MFIKINGELGLMSLDLKNLDTFNTLNLKTYLEKFIELEKGKLDFTGRWCLLHLFNSKGEHLGNFGYLLGLDKNIINDELLSNLKSYILSFLEYYDEVEFVSSDPSIFYFYISKNNKKNDDDDDYDNDEEDYIYDTWYGYKISSL
jgi:hypothetical protein